MEVHLVDGTYELFRHHFAVPSHVTDEGVEVAAARGALGSMIRLLEAGATHVGVATDHVIDSFRNRLFDGYKTGEGTPPELFAQFALFEALLDAAGFTVFPMVEHEADDAMGAAALKAAADQRVERVLICTPDKDLAQCVSADSRIVQFDRRREIVYDWDGVVDKFGVTPPSIPDWLALVGDSADGIPGLAGWGARSSAIVLSRYGHIDHVPNSHEDWDIKVRGAERLAGTLVEHRSDALLYRRLATLDLEAPVMADVDELHWTGPLDHLVTMCSHLDAPRLGARAAKLAETRN
ncbi:MAG TPA: 5'-3' exonuclease H3TH domain-containing protein [Acidimicrobiales bacterium]|jgi:5'-3' exonuclease|nr:flap endonuclease [Actinomycetota bacterium]MDP6061705.1 5'-3' exonuclease H3TH domain-containing protein [Acidimicrobiales bacterium]MDP7210126.1 5'-3' exonuclease H3TH domain-containing protein [Acidimicrobiales bacterium]HJL89562.1 5'-3' exonuclease H3TH domain-containing protein [Acidimicrobiales bacterium]HJO99442.1 5'-3' exonuclease H3TH domain-containing protein [Acidimicrobiales bacterium]|tara:strand:+ start:3183 stop:4064 length:882 start_codon:yes stop_codon:yes gene_type:complete